MERELKESNKLVKYFIYFLCILTPILIVFEGWVLLDTVNAISFMITYTIVGAIIIGVLIYFFYKKYPKYIDFKHVKRRKRIITNYICLIVCFVFSAAFINFFTAYNEVSKKQVVVIQKDKSYRYGYKSFIINLFGQKKKFSVSTNEWNSVHVGETITINIGEGLLGYKCIVAFNGEKIWFT